MVFSDIYNLAAMSLCFVDTSAAAVRDRCENLCLTEADRAGLLDAVTALHLAYRTQLAQIDRDELGRPLDKEAFDSLFFKVNCLASAKDALAL